MKDTSKTEPFPQRKWNRLPGFDYHTPGAYFITITTKDNVPLFGQIIQDSIELNDAGQMINAKWHEIPQKYPGTEIDTSIVMPNHLHGIIWIHPHPERPFLPDIIRWFKTITTNVYIRRVKNKGWKPFAGQLWLRSYYDRIIRDDVELENIRKYILNNPLNWTLNQEGLI